MASPGTPVPPSPASHRWRFFRAGGFDQVLLETGADLLALGSLDQKLWVALSCPVAGIDFDARTLELVDSDGDGHIRAPEIIAAAAWAGRALKDPDLLVRRQDRLPLSVVDESTEEGKAVLSGAKLVLLALGKPDAGEITLEDAADTARIYSQARFNGDGIVTARSAGDPALAAVIADIVACLGGRADRSGEPGVDTGTIERFYAEAEALRAWWDKGSDPAIKPFGQDTEARHALVNALRPKIEDYFTRCRLAEYDGRSAPLLSPADADYRELSAAALDASVEPMSRLPIAVPEARKPMPLVSGVNPAFSDAVRRFRAEVAAPILGDAESLTEDGWAAVRARFTPYESWLAEKPATSLETLGEARVRRILAEDERAALLDLAARDLAVAPEAEAVASVEKLLRYCRDLHVLANNFVSFRDFYTRKGRATFQAGTLYLDGRSAELCVRVADVARHAAIAAQSGVCLVYCDCVRRGGTEKMTIAAAFTAGDSDFLSVGRNGIFYDRKGQDWDATIVRIVEHPISIRQAFFAPYKRIARLLGEQVRKLAAARQRAAEEQAALRAIEAAGQAASGKPAPPPPPPFDVAKFAGIFAAIGLAVGAIGAALASLVGGLFRLAWWQIPLAFAGAVLVVSCPSVFLAWLKLRKRNLGPILDANGWAVNARAKINIPFGASLTASAKLPDNAERLLADPFAEKKRPWLAYAIAAAIAAAIAVLWRMGVFRRG